MAELTRTPIGKSLLLVSSEPGETGALRSFLASHGYAVHVTTGPGAIHSLAFRSYGLVVIDVGLPGIDGVALTRRALELDHETTVLLIVHRGATVPLVEALKLGARDYVSAPIVPAELERKLEALRPAAGSDVGDSALIAESQDMKSVVSRAAHACGVEFPVFLQGELGTGRKTIARAIHRFSASRMEPFLALNVKTIPSHLLASELFGSRPSPAEEGSHQGVLRAAGRGAVFLENVDAMSSTVQLKLIGALDTGMIHPLGPSLDARLFCSSDRDLDTLVARGVFQSGLHYRLNALRIAIRPLRERPDDIPALAAHFLQRFSEGVQRPTLGITDETLSALCHYSWPGNVRELANVMERAFVRAGESIELVHLPTHISSVTVRRRPQADSTV